MRKLLVLLLAAPCFAQSPAPQLPPNDATRVQEFYHLSPQLEAKVWPGWAGAPDSLLLVTDPTEFLFHFPDPPAEFQKLPGGVLARPRQFPVNLQATFPAFGPPSVIVIGPPESTEAHASTPWLFVVMHEHFHQLQDAHPGIFDAVTKLGLAHGDQTGMWMLNYPFPYEKPEVVASFSSLRDLLLKALNEPDNAKFRAVARQYAAERAKFFASLAPDDRKYLNFQLWKEGIARYVQVKSAEAAANLQPTPQFAALPDYEPFASYAARARKDTLRELARINLATAQRNVVYSFGASEGFLLDRLHPSWSNSYFQNLFTLDPYFTE